MPGQKELNKLVSLTFDENPEVRKRAANLLADSKDPAALFALMELSYDKEPSVREVATEILNKAKNQSDEMMSFAEIFGRGEKKDKKPDKKEKREGKSSKKDKILKPIEQMFEKRLGKEKAEIVKKKMMPTIEKIYFNSKHKKKEEDDEKERKAVQEFLTDYLEVVAGLDEIEESAPAEVGNVKEIEVSSNISEELEVVGKDFEPDKVAADLFSIEDEELDFEDEEKVEERAISELPDTFFKKAYETMMLSDGDEKVMKKEMKRMTRQAERDIKLAYNLAKNKFKKLNITHLTAIKNRMRNINTEVLEVVEAETKEYQKSKRVRDVMTRLVLRDESGNEGILYLFEGRGSGIKEGFRLKISKAYAKTFKFSGETALTLGKKGEIYIVL